VARCGGGGRLIVVVEGEVDGELAVELGAEAGVLFPAGEGVAVDSEGLGDDGGGVAEEEEAGGGELDGLEGVATRLGSG
jgi:hypothetical protein